MRNLFPGKRHISILTQLFALLLTFATRYTIFTLPARAQVAVNCSVKSGACPPNQQFTCSATGVSTGCCSDSNACNLYKTTQTRSRSATTNGSNTQGQGVLKVNPEGNCSGGIDTALGCIPYDTKGFTAALLGFLAGIVGLIALIVMIIATIMIMTGGSNPEQVKKGKELFTGGITGLFFIIFSVTILRIIAGDIIKLPGFN